MGGGRSNFLGTTFVIYSHGRNPMKKEGLTSKKLDLPIREELGAVLYVSLHLLCRKRIHFSVFKEPNVFGFKGPRKMTILMHTLTRDGKRPEFRPTVVRGKGFRDLHPVMRQTGS